MTPETGFGRLPHNQAMVGGTRNVRLLDTHTVNQIAAGEVVERPASVVKELLENALDAGATRVEIELEDCGRASIKVTDDGCGMSAEDAESAIQRHATSKISGLDDLQTILSLGFRGEALPSIASVSTLTLVSAEEHGSRSVIKVESGQVTREAERPGPKGTEISVEGLFDHTPARLKFLKSDATELSASVEIVARYGIARPEVALSLSHNGQNLIKTTGSGDMHQAISEVWGREVAKGLAEVDVTAAGMRVRGFVSPPHLTRPTRAYQYLFVNGRLVRSRTLTAALDQAYRDLTPERRHPVVALMLEIEPSRVDVNVSPTKTEIRFQHEGQAFEALRIAVKSSLMQHGMMPSAAGIAAANEAIQNSTPHFPTMQTAAVSAFAMSSFAQSPLGATQDNLEEAFAPVDSVRYPFADLLDDLKVLGQIMATFIIAETRRGLAIIDQHVAHERILYEYLCGLRGPTAIEKQPMLSPLTLHLDRRSALLLKERIEEVQKVGFDLEHFGGESFIVRSAPAALKGKDPLKVLQDMVDELVEGSVTRRLSPTREQIWITSSCKMAVKAGDPLSIPEMEKLIVDLASTENPYMCPHGRPITITLSREELLRKFKRT